MTRSPRTGTPRQPLETSPLAVLPEQFFRRPTDAAGWTPEKRLMAAVIEDVIHTFHRHRGLRDHQAQRLVWEAETWLLSDDITWPYAFRNLCDALGLEPSAVRTALLRTRDPRRLAA